MLWYKSSLLDDEWNVGSMKVVTISDYPVMYLDMHFSTTSNPCCWCQLFPASRARIREAYKRALGIGTSREGKRSPRAGRNAKASWMGKARERTSSTRRERTWKTQGAWERKIRETKVSNNFFYSFLYIYSLVYSFLISCYCSFKVFVLFKCCVLFQMKWFTIQLQ